MNLLGFSLLTALGINLVMFIVAFIKQTDTLTDISYAVTFGVLAVFGLTQSTVKPAHVIIFTCVILWALRLGGFLLMRIRWMKKDRRFDGMREHFWLFLRFWVLQGFTVFVVMLSSIKLFQNTTPAINLLSIFGLLVFLAGLVVESTADLQKFAFNKNPKNKDMWISTGIWSKSRHPNYLGEMMVWTGLFIFTLPSLQGWNILVASLSPLFIITLLLFVSGIPLLEKSADKKWGNNQSYQTYKQSTPVLLPKI
jgi:steroid 5-alpha reductase family enzyme